MVSEATEVFYELIRGFTSMYSDILQLIDSASLKHRMIHCGGGVFEEFSSTFLHIFAVDFRGTFRFPLLMFSLASGAKEFKQVLKLCTIIRFFLHTLKAIPTFH